MAANAAELPENQEASAAAETINDALTELGGDSGSNAAILEAQPTTTRNSAKGITSWAGNNIWEVMGLGSCGSLIREAIR